MSSPDLDATTSESGFRLSPQQRRTWRLDAARGVQGRPTVAVWTVEGDLDAAALAVALGEAVAREEILRTRFRRPAGMSMPLMEIAPALAPRIGRRDLSGLPEAERAAAVEGVLDALGREPFDLEVGPALRAELVRLGPARSLLALAAPALNLDRPGLESLAARLAGVSATAGGGADDDEPLQYADVAEWQNGLEDAEEGEEDREAWRRLDLAAEARRRLPFERELPAAAVAGVAGAAAPGGAFAPRSRWAEPPAGAVSSLTTLADRAEASGPDVVLAAWGIVLSRLSGGGELVLGAVVDGREYEELRGVPGTLSKVVPLVLASDERRTPERAVRDAARALADARAGQEYWTWRAVGIASGEESSGPPMLPLGFETRPERPALSWRGSGPRLVPSSERSYVEPFALQLVCHLPAPSGGPDRPSFPRLELRYDPDRVDARDAERTLEQLVALLGSLSGYVRSIAEVADADGLAASERPSAVAAPVPGDGGTVVDRFLERVSEDPARPALACEERSLSYGELEALSGRWARRLRVLGCGPEAPVVVCLDRSVETVAAILAVLRAGGAYLPVDPAQPRRRIEAMLDGSGARLAIAGPETGALFDGAGVTVVTLDDLDQLDQLDDLDDLDQPAEAGAALPRPRPEQLAYVLYTSGSTGAPKGVAVEHRQLAAYVSAAIERLDLLDLPPGASFATVSTFAADLGHTMVFPALATGGLIHVIADPRVSDPEAFAEYVERHAIDCLKLVPGHLEALLTARDPERVPPRRRLILGGETFGWELAGRLRELAPGCRVFNHYGPTETTVGAVADEVPVDPPRSASVPLGRPLAGARVHLLDPSGGRLRPVPTWAAGEVFVGGSGVARGYLGRPATTAERFVPDPFAGCPGERLYRTGDLARRLPGGAFEFLGRADDQVKVRGFRVEPGEIVSLLRGHPAVREAAILARGDDGSEPRLVAYVVPRPGEAPEAVAADALRSFLGERLPEAMIPSTFVALVSLPRTANGKLDRSALPAPEAVRPELAATYVPPGTETERAVAAIWGDVLHLERVGLHDNFFDLGGHSLLLVKVSARLRERFGLDLSMVDLFRRTTVAQVVELLAAGTADGAGAAADEGEARARAESRQESLQRQREMRRRRRTVTG